MAISINYLLIMGQASAQLNFIGKVEGQVDILAWRGYLERGATDKNFDWVTDFEKKTNCKVNIKTASTSEEMVALMNGSGIDLVTASGDASLQMIVNNRVQEINTALVPSYKNIDPRLANASWHTVGGKHYGVPYQWGVTVLAYNAKIFPDAPKSWSVVYEEQNLPDGKSNKGRIQSFNDPMKIAEAALYLKTKNPELNISDPYELNTIQYKAVIDLLRAHKKLVSRFWRDTTLQIEDFKNGDLAVSSSWPFQVNALQADKLAMEKVPIASVIPEEGTTGWADTTMMHINAKHPNCSYMWLEHSLNPKLQGDLAAWVASVPVILAACKGNLLLTDNGCATNGSDNFEKVYFWRTPVATCPSQKTGCVPYQQWVVDIKSISN